MSAAPQPVTTCVVCGTPVASDAGRCPSCGLSRPAARGGSVLGRRGLWLIATVMIAVYVIVLLIVAAAR
jgi:uncharacterized membrane protein